jgi:hypothetical protein
MFFEPVIGGYATREGRARSSMPSVIGERSRALAQLVDPMLSGVLWLLIASAAVRCFGLGEALDRNKACRKPVGTADDNEGVACAGNEVNFIRCRLCSTTLQWAAIPQFPTLFPTSSNRLFECRSKSQLAFRRLKAHLIDQLLAPSKGCHSALAGTSAVFGSIPLPKFRRGSGKARSRRKT